MSPEDALTRLKKYWANHGGLDYLNELLILRREISMQHPSSRALDREIESCTKVHSKFILWTRTKAAKALLNKSKKNAKH